MVQCLSSKADSRKQIQNCACVLIMTKRQSVLPVAHILALLLWLWCFLLPIAGDVRFSLNGTIYQNNSIVTLENIGEGGDALLCITDITDCCRPPASYNAIGNWFFPNGSRVPSSGNQWDIHRTRGQSVVLLHRRRGGADGIYRCEIPLPQSDAEDVTQTIFIGVYTANTGKTPLINKPIKVNL